MELHIPLCREFTDMPDHILESAYYVLVGIYILIRRSLRSVWVNRRPSFSRA